VVGGQRSGDGTVVIQAGDAGCRSRDQALLRDHVCSCRSKDLAGFHDLALARVNTSSRLEWIDMGDIAKIAKEYGAHIAAP
jgi:hypothetical protein